MPTVVVLSGCVGSLSTVDPAGPAAEAIATLWWVLLAGAVVIFVLTMMLLTLAFRRARPGALDGRERFWFGGLGLAFPIVVLGALSIYGLLIGERLLPRDAPDLVTVQAEGRRWEWRFSYSDAPGRVTENVLHIPAGRPVDVEITTADVIHSFWVPRLAGKLDAIPGHRNVLRIEASDPGNYAGVSAEYSGPGYLGHVFTVRAHNPASWDAFLAGETP